MNIDTHTGADTDTDRGTYLKMEVLGHKVNLYLTFDLSLHSLLSFIDSEYLSKFSFSHTL
jgi:hypothetical protein